MVYFKAVIILINCCLTLSATQSYCSYGCYW